MRRARGPAPGGRRTARRPLGSSGQDPLLRDWLTHAQSLTARIRARSQVFRVKVVFQGMARLHPLEAAALAHFQGQRATGARAAAVVRQGSSAGAVAYVREVLLVADGVAVVWARTVLPRQALRGPWRFLAGLGARPLGERLFTDPAITRTPFAFHPVGALRARRPPPLRPLAARRAFLLRGGMPAVLTEALLPAIRRLSTGP